MAQDYEVWLDGGKSLLDWGSYGGKDIKTLPGTKQPVHVYMDFKSNSIAAEEKYRGVQRIVGYVSAIERDYQGKPRLLFRVGTFDRLYAYGLTKNEIIKLKVSDRVDLQCMDFQLNSVGDIVGSCSMIMGKNRVIAINTIQYLEKKNELKIPNKLKAEFDLIRPFINKDIERKVNDECADIDSINISKCYSYAESFLDFEKMQELKEQRK